MVSKFTCFTNGIKRFYKTMYKSMSCFQCENKIKHVMVKVINDIFYTCQNGGPLHEHSQSSLCV